MPIYEYCCEICERRVNVRVQWIGIGRIETLANFGRQGRLHEVPTLQANQPRYRAAL